ncbi:hypothetical protein J1N35_018415 [Gossypium stocksii]|uniref:Receptor-like protein kinase At4g00960 n=1 Tax=Gossypium stocksii TaxID=47602 RepID=A0A9D3VR38_9ROSI|nr:hypothetical protein J1N35_018415 [Gossypium stocksii]
MKWEMGSSSSTTFLLFLYSFLLAPATLTLSQLNDVYFERNCSDTNGNYTPNSAYQTSLNAIISQFPTLTCFNYGFFNLSAGESLDKVYSSALCRGDLTQDRCYSCLNYTGTELERFCPWNKAAITWSELCLVRYANRDMYGLLENDPPRTCVYNEQNASNPVQFNQALSDLLNELSAKAAAGGPFPKYAAGNASAGNLEMVYATVQCTPDMTQENCVTCLNFAMTELQRCCLGRKGCRVLRPTCVLRFESNLFYNEIAVPLPSAPPSPTTSPTPKVVGLLILIIISVCIFMRRRRNKHMPIKVETAAADNEISGVDTLQFNFDSVLVATDNFSDVKKLGQGGFGAVYKGQLPNGEEKRLSQGSGQGDLEFQTEVQLVAKLQRRNLVRLLGFCLQGQERLLIYEFVPNASLDHFIFDRRRRAQLDWEARFKIIQGIVRRLLYLHEDSRLRIIHRDLKASNVLLDAEMVPKIADFGMARLFGQDETQRSTSRIVGTYGYMAPEYVINGQFSIKSDVFSFGVLLLEIISGQKNNSFHHGEDEEYILSFAWKCWRERTALNLVDPILSDGSRNEIRRCIHIALLCVQQNVAARPTMASVALMLNNFSTTLVVPSQPAFLMQSNFESEGSLSFPSTSNKSSTELPPLSRNEVTISELSPR